MTSWEPERLSDHGHKIVYRPSDPGPIELEDEWDRIKVTFSKKATAGGIFIAACCFAVGFLILYWQGF